ncbi:TPA: hypothetical protein HA278_06425 [Candidatus Woesearchaeota archaeon]|nr:hypothetical protein [Candidatus Woesearchaeota archaeon]|tara:strand:+ start:1358 stop:1573 length:216 start_codon:yes stop_codon:yes gene_type:complete
MNESKSTISQGTSLPTLLTVLFIALKLCGVIDWSWWWVLSPIPITVGLIVAVCVIVYGVFTIQKNLEDKRG